MMTMILNVLEKVLEMNEEKIKKFFYKLKKIVIDNQQKKNLFMKSILCLIIDNDFKPKEKIFFLEESGRLLGDILSPEEQACFLTKVIDCCPWAFRFLVQKIDEKTGLSENGFDMNLLDNDNKYCLKFSSGYVAGMCIKEDKDLYGQYWKEWYKVWKSGDLPGIKQYMALVGFPELIEEEDKFRKYPLISFPSLYADKFTRRDFTWLMSALTKKFYLDPNRKDSTGQNSMAILFGKHPDIAVKLLPVLKENGVDIFSLDTNGNSLLHIATWVIQEYFTEESLAKYLKPLSRADLLKMEEMFKDMLQYLVVDHGIDVNIKNNIGSNPLKWFFIKYDLSEPNDFDEFIKLFLDHGMSFDSVLDIENSKELVQPFVDRNYNREICKSLARLSKDIDDLQTQALPLFLEHVNNEFIRIENLLEKLIKAGLEEFLPESCNSLEKTKGKFYMLVGKLADSKLAGFDPNASCLEENSLI